jgi:hypothetical protein
MRGLSAFMASEGTTVPYLPASPIGYNIPYPSTQAEKYVGEKELRKKTKEIDFGRIWVDNKRIYPNADSHQTADGAHNYGA